MRKPGDQAALASRPWSFKVMLHALGSEVGSVLLIAALWAIYVGLASIKTVEDLGLLAWVRGGALVLISGVFVGVIVVTEEAKAYWQSGNRVRIVCGAVAGAAIALIAGGAWDHVLMAAAVGVAPLREDVGRTSMRQHNLPAGADVMCKASHGGPGIVLREFVSIRSM